MFAETYMFKKCLQNKISHTQNNNGAYLRPVFKMVC